MFVNTGNVFSLKLFHKGDDFEIFSERLEQYLLANKVVEAIEVSVLLTTVLSEDV